MSLPHSTDVEQELVADAAPSPRSPRDDGGDLTAGLQVPLSTKSGLPMGMLRAVGGIGKPVEFKIGEMMLFSVNAPCCDDCGKPQLADAEAQEGKIKQKKQGKKKGMAGDLKWCLCPTPEGATLCISSNKPMQVRSHC